jgi:hypothetical protein
MMTLVRFYQRYLTRYTVACPRAGLSCSDLVLATGAGPVAAFRIVRSCALCPTHTAGWNR